ncbi:MAG: S8 family serine peptidase, partial [Anaerolineae bacterium]
MPHFRSHARLLLAASLLPILVLAGLIQSAAQSLPPEDPTGPEVAPHPGLGRVEPALLKQVLEASPGQSFRVIVELQNQADLSAWQAQSAGPEQVVGALQAEAARSQASLLSFLDAESTAGRVTDVHPFWGLNGVGLTGGAETLLALATRPEVALIREDRWRQWVDPILVPRASTDESPALPWNVSQVGADRVWNSFEIDGGGVTVAIMDTGVDWQHPALQAQYRGYKPGGLTVHEGNWFCTTSEAAAYPVDGYGHGTHVAGTVLGRAVGGQPAIGVAPGAQWIAVKTLNDAGWGYDSWIHAAFEWLLAPAGNPALAPDVVNGSWGKANGESDVFRADLQALRAAGIVPVFAAGNGGPEPETMGSPASYPEAIAVGASNDLDQVLDFSSRGPSFWGEVKPEVVAPGLDILSSLPGGTYATSYGTSMAAPHVSGLAALLLQADGGLSVDEVEALIAGTALPLGPELPNNDSGRGRIDAYQAVATALQAGSIRGEVRTTAAGSSPIAGAQISVYDEQNQRRAIVQTDEAGLYSVALPAGVYRLLVEAFAFAPQ